jgi:hypothetical protein
VADDYAMKQLMWLSLQIVLASCGDNRERALRAEQDRRIEDVKARHGPVIRTRIDRARELDRLYEGMDRPPITDEPPASSPRLTRRNTDIVYEHDLMMLRSGALARGASLLGYTPAQDAGEVDGIIERAAQVMYVAVLRTSWLSSPTADLTHSTYRGGWASAEVVVFDLRVAPVRTIGAFRVDAHLTGTVRVRASEGAKVVLGDLDAALQGAMYRAVEAKLDP